MPEERGVSLFTLIVRHPVFVLRVRKRSLRCHLGVSLGTGTPFIFTYLQSCLWQPGCTWCSEVADGSELAIGCLKTDSYADCPDNMSYSSKLKVIIFPTFIDFCHFKLSD